MRRLALGFTFSLALFISAAAPAYAANLPLLDPNFTVVPSQCTTCACGWGGVLQLVQNLMNVGISIGVIAFVLVAAYAGFQFMVNPTNPEARNQAKSMLFNVVIGMFIVLSAWLLVDFIMKTLYNPDATSAGVQYGPWNEILTDKSGTTCIQPTHSAPIGSDLPNKTVGAIFGAPGAPPSGSGNSGSCSPKGLQQAGMPSNLAATMSCITKYEDGPCRPNEPSGTDIGVDGKPISFGFFQVNLSAHNLDTPACIAASPTKQALQCKNAFNTQFKSRSSGTRVTNLSLYQQCISAVSNPACNISIGVQTYNSEGIGAWGKPAQGACGG